MSDVPWEFIELINEGEKIIEMERTLEEKEARRAQDIQMDAWDLYYEQAMKPLPAVLDEYLRRAYEGMPPKQNKSYLLTFVIPGCAPIRVNSTEKDPDRFYVAECICELDEADEKTGETFFISFVRERMCLGLPKAIAYARAIYLDAVRQSENWKTNQALPDPAYVPVEDMLLSPLAAVLSHPAMEDLVNLIRDVVKEDKI